MQSDRNCYLVAEIKIEARRCVRSVRVIRSLSWGRPMRFQNFESTCRYRSPINCSRKLFRDYHCSSVLPFFRRKIPILFIRPLQIPSRNNSLPFSKNSLRSVKFAIRKYIRFHYTLEIIISIVRYCDRFFFFFKFFKKEKASKLISKSQKFHINEYYVHYRNSSPQKRNHDIYINIYPEKETNMRNSKYR